MRREEGTGAQEWMTCWEIDRKTEVRLVYTKGALSWRGRFEPWWYELKREKNTYKYIKQNNNSNKNKKRKNERITNIRVQGTHRRSTKLSHWLPQKSCNTEKSVKQFRARFSRFVCNIMIANIQIEHTRTPNRMCVCKHKHIRKPLSLSFFIAGLFIVCVCVQTFRHLNLHWLLRCGLWWVKWWCWHSLHTFIDMNARAHACFYTILIV